VRVIVDADACPVKDMIVRYAKEKSITVIMVIDTSHVINDGYSEVITVDKAKDSADIKLINIAKEGDLIITQDFGVAAMAIAKKAYAINQNGMIYDKDNIDRLLFERHIGQKVRRSGGRTTGPRKRTKEDDEAFFITYKELLDR